MPPEEAGTLTGVGAGAGAADGFGATGAAGVGATTGAATTDGFPSNAAVIGQGSPWTPPCKLLSPST
ncbi:MAG: hypothetical protein HN444_04550 [Euryarchaeota archaeon]|nr:hypothetical protein [Euryarchaeota archaeon]